MTTSPLITYIMVNYHNDAATRQCVSSIIADANGRDIQIIIVDNGVERTDLAFNEAFIDVITSPANLGFAGGNNLALTKATGTYIAFINFDAYVLPGWTSEMLKVLESDASIVACGGAEVAWDGELETRDSAVTTTLIGPPLIDPKTGDTRMETGTIDGPLSVPYVTASNILLRRADVQPWDAAYFLYYEDTDYSAALLRRGGTIMYVPAARVRHRINLATNTTGSRKWFYIYRNRFRFAVKYFEPSSLRTGVMTGFGREVWRVGVDSTKLLLLWLPRHGRNDYEEWSRNTRGHARALIWVVFHLATLVTLRRLSYQPDFRYNEVVTKLNAERASVLAHTS